MNNGKVFITIGVPGAGKSTYYEQMLEGSWQSDGVVVVSPDAVRRKNNWDGGDFKRSAEAFDICRQEAKAALLDGMDVVFDATATVKKYRVQLINFFKPLAKDIVGVYFKIDVELAVKRNATRREEDDYYASLSDDIVRRMYNQLMSNEPTLEEGFTELVVIEQK